MDSWRRASPALAGRSTGVNTLRTSGGRQGLRWMIEVKVGAREVMGGQTVPQGVHVKTLTLSYRELNCHRRVLSRDVIQFHLCLNRILPALIPRTIYTGARDGRLEVMAIRGTGLEMQIRTMSTWELPEEAVGIYLGGFAVCRFKRGAKDAALVKNS